MRHTMRHTMRPVAILLCLPAAAAAQESYDCVIEPSLVLEVGSAEEGVVEEVLVNRGDPVARGQVIARLESAAERAALTYASERAENAAPVEIARERVALLGKELERAAALGDKDLVATSVVETAASDHELARLEQRQAEFEQHLAELDLARVEAQLDRRVIRSPLDGIVIARMVGPGEFAYSQAPIAQLARIDPLHVEVFLPSDVYPHVSIGQTLTVEAAEPVGGSYEAGIVVVDKVFDAASDTFGVRLSLPNPGNALPAGIDCRIVFGS